MRKNKTRHKNIFIIVFCLLLILFLQENVCAVEWKDNWGYEEDDSERRRWEERQADKPKPPEVTEHESYDAEGKLTVKTIATVSKEGIRIETLLYYKNGNVKKQTIYVKGDLFLVKSFYEDGSSKEEISYKENKFDGPTNRYFKSGNIKESLFYRNGKPEGSNKVFFEDGKIREESFYRGGKLNGFKKKFYRDGKLKFKAKYKNDKLDGLVEEYFSNGSEKSKVQYNLGKMHGSYKEYYEAGNLKVEGYYQDGSRQGKFQEYYVTEVLKSQTLYNSNGELEGHKDFYDDGFLKNEQYYDGVSASVIQRSYHRFGQQFSLNAPDKLEDMDKNELLRYYFSRNDEIDEDEDDEEDDEIEDDGDDKDDEYEDEIYGEPIKCFIKEMGNVLEGDMCDSECLELGWMCHEYESWCSVIFN